MTITIKDVAKDAGVSIATVSRVLNGKDKVKPSTKQKVEQSIKKLNYLPDLTAQTMVSKKTKTIGLIVPSLHEYWATLAENIQEQLWEYGYTVMFCVSGLVESGKLFTYINSFIQRKVDGIIYCGPGSEHTSFILELLDGKIPIVVLDRTLPDVNSVYGDHLEGGKIGAEHLIKLGHKDIAYVGGPFSSPERELGFRNGMTLHGLTVNESLIKRGEFTFECGFNSANELLDGKSKFTAVCCGNDLIAFGVIDALRKRGKRVPEDIAIVGYDDIKMASLIKPELTTVRQPLEKIAIGLIDLLLETIDMHDTKQIKSLVFSMELIIRESCGARQMMELSR
ncbi:LacI family DNA-binding transcriptional regulator [Lederbergia wuyishanensis]|uniref:DNA-binding LacI/PurR family transcriptional regulator n=1 Tax=Lederbergia wuyishanensis TaxID=1347903 RepID=A0ABU0DAC5_9BACI|nr:LacI family DNA-binding transcriptional regulator [Lederbergia wuyishanensis]MCJ8009933.1 LacI family transcriptional regulator [Lederbergia wuyishanensis]MDQ0345280.1 DNA-binding LacI/PurR family transcriptional regulator [Lederbergia wuyishanensis]